MEDGMPKTGNQPAAQEHTRVVQPYRHQLSTLNARTYPRTKDIAARCPYPSHFALAEGVTELLQFGCSIPAGSGGFFILNNLFIA